MHAEVESHLRQCAACRASLRLIQEIPAAMRPEVEVPEAWIRRAAAVAHEGSRTSAVPAAAAAALLGLTTTAVTLVMTGVFGGGGPLELFLFSCAGGAIAALVEIRLGRREAAPRLGHASSG